MSSIQTVWKTLPQFTAHNKRSKGIKTIPELFINEDIQDDN